MSDPGRSTAEPVEDAQSWISDGPVQGAATGVVGLSLRRNFSWTLAGNVVYAGCQWGMLTVIAKLGSPEMVGRFALGLAVTAPVFMFASLRLRAVLATDSSSGFVFGDYLALRYVTLVLALLAVLGIVIAARYRLEVASVILAVGLAKAFESVSDVHYGLCQQCERMDRIAASMIIKGPLSLVTLGVGVYLTHSVFWGAVGLAAAWALVLAAYDAKSGAFLARLSPERSDPLSGVLLTRLVSRLNDVEAVFRRGGDPLAPRWHLRTMLDLTALSVPLGTAMMLVSLNTNIPRYFVEKYLGERNLGIFAAMTYLMVAGTTVVSALAQSAIPRLARYYAIGSRHQFGSLLAKLVGFGAAVGFAGLGVALFAGRWTLDTLYGPAYAEHTKVFVVVAAAAIMSLMQWFLSNGMTAARYFRVQVPLYASATAITALASLWLIPRYGLMGAALTLLVAEAALAFGTLAVDVHAISRIGSRPAGV
jgi:O-antigen/teichoic acid export membrane protein